MELGIPPEVGFCTVVRLRLASSKVDSAFRGGYACFAASD
jgi:hypothetical protein